MANTFTYKSFVDDVFKDMVKSEKKILRKAAAHVRKKMREKVSRKSRAKPGMPPGLGEGNLRRGIKFDVVDRDHALVGLSSPAQHGHLLEFGTQERYTEKGVYKGRVAPMPFVIPTFMEETEAVRQIMREFSV